MNTYEPQQLGYEREITLTKIFSKYLTQKRLY